MAGELKSAWELAMEKAKKMGEDDLPSLSPNEKQEIAEVRKVYEAKFAEVEILVQDKEKRDLDLDRLRRSTRRQGERERNEWRMGVITLPRSKPPFTKAYPNSGERQEVNRR